ncbi:hypothetical protein H9X77_17110, partial [Clostridium saudiense]|nr:hypothetical protein [Clostridium saudiense]
MKILNRLLIILLIFSLVSCSDKATSIRIDETSDTLLEQTSDWSNFQYKIDTDGHVEKIMKDLCSDAYLGRVVGTKENEKTQEYIK